MHYLVRRGGLGVLLVVVGVALSATSAAAMGDNLIGQLMEQFQQYLSDRWNDFYNPIYLWYAAWVAGFALAVTIAIFVPFKIVRLSLGLLLLLGAAFVAGGRQMGERQRERINALRDQLKEEKDKRNDRPPSSGGGGFFDMFK